MKKKLIIGAAVAMGLMAVMAAASKKCRTESGSAKWDRMRKRMEAMPEDFPPRVMFDNVAAAKENTDQILALLSEERAEQELATSS